MASITRQAYAEMFGPTVGDRLRLADTALVIEIEKDHTIYGEEVKFCGGKVIRDGMGQSRTVELIEVSGSRIIHGFTGQVNGKLKK